MPKCNIIVVGASAGGVSALTDFVKSLPQDLPVSVFIVLHTPPYSPSHLPQILTRAGALKATHAEDGEQIEQGRIYIAPPDHHLLLEKGNRMIVKKGPKENGFRPCVDALFRSAAYIYGSRVVGVVLSGMLDDGTSGMWAIKRRGGITIVQHPEDAMYPSMPQNVMQYVAVDHVTPVAKMGALIGALVMQKAAKNPDLTKEEMKLLKMEVIIATRGDAFEIGILEMGQLTTFTCPECHGALVSIFEGQMIRFRCHTGHAYTTSSLLAGVTQSVEEKLWEAMRALEETTMLLNQIGAHYKEIGNVQASKLFIKKGKEIAMRTKIVHDSVFTQELMSEDMRFGEGQLYD